MHCRKCNVFKIKQKAKENIKVFSLVLKVVRLGQVLKS